MARGDGKNKYGHPLPYKHGEKKEKNVCEECTFYGGDHGPSCSQHPNNKRKKR